MSCGVGCRHVLDLALLWLWYRPVATAPIQSLAWELPHAVGAAKTQTQKQLSMVNSTKSKVIENRLGKNVLRI